MKFIYLQYEEILKALGTTKLLAIEFKSTEVEDVLDKHFFRFTHITVSDDNNSLAMAIVDSCHQIKAEFKFKLEDMVASSKKYLHQLELLQTPKSIEVSTDNYWDHTGKNWVSLKTILFIFQQIFQPITLQSSEIFSAELCGNWLKNVRISITGSYFIDVSFCNQRNSLKLL